MNGIKHGIPLYQQAYIQVKRSILNGSLEPGSKIVVGQLAEEYEVSRTPLREALRQLQNDGLIKFQTNGTISIIDLDEKDFIELCFCRRILEKEIIQEAIRCITNDTLEEIKVILDQSEEAVNTEDDLEVLRLNTEFHEKIILSCENKRLIELLERTRAFLLIYRAKIVKETDQSKTVKEHRQIYNYLCKRDEEAAVKAIEHHLDNDLERGKEFFKDRSR
ncbi:GntR family transcriptional regulator [Alteribacillus sp. HJP-4]|uniref:GntR family transcriptional regulator n=1 Tax=Alteribacillus sp. HJP-4 TaxID=2775394 RepID=UPI0035CD282B